VIRDQADLRRIFERKMQERQEFLDRYFVFSGQEWSPPKDWSRTNGLVEDIRKSYRLLKEEEQTLTDAAGPEKLDRVPSDPLDLPGTPKVGGSAGEGARPVRRAPGLPVAPAAPGAAPAPVPPPAPAAPAPTGQNNEPDESPVRITPIARSVNVERVE